MEKQDEKIIDISEIEKEKELLDTIKMEPIIEKTEIKEEESFTKKKKMIKITDIVLMILIVLLIASFVIALIFIN